MAEMRLPNFSLSRAAEARQFRLIYTATFGVFLIVAILARLAPWRWRQGAHGYKSIIGEAKAAANTVIPFAFMG